MSLLRYLVWFILGWLIFYFAKRLISKTKNPGKVSRKPKPPIDHMVRCGKCGLHVPQQEAIQDGDRYYCCQEHHDSDRTQP